MRVLIACEFSGTVRGAFAALGHTAMSCDMLPSEQLGLHYTGDVRHVLDGWQPVQYSGQCDPDGDEWVRAQDYADLNEYSALVEMKLQAEVERLRAIAREALHRHQTGIRYIVRGKEDEVLVFLREWTMVADSLSQICKAPSPLPVQCQHDLQKPGNTIMVGVDETATDIYQTARCTVCGFTQMQAFPKSEAAHK